jgi:hypothetical protein
VDRGIALPFHDLGARRGWVVSTTPRPLYPRERLGTQCTGGWVGPSAGLDVCENRTPTRIRSPDRPARSQSLYRQSYPDHYTSINHWKIHKLDVTPKIYELVLASLNEMCDQISNIRAVTFAEFWRQFVSCNWQYHIAVVRKIFLQLHEFSLEVTPAVRLDSSLVIAKQMCERVNTSNSWEWVLSFTEKCYCSSSTEYF